MTEGVNRGFRSADEEQVPRDRLPGSAAVQRPAFRVLRGVQQVGV
jgi:hypothetical protein